MTQIYNFILFTLGTVLIYIGAINSDSGYLWNACLIAGGVYIGHVITNVFDDPTDSME